MTLDFILMMTKLYNLSYFAVCDFKNTPLEVM